MSATTLITLLETVVNLPSGALFQQLSQVSSMSSDAPIHQGINRPQMLHSKTCQALTLLTMAVNRAAANQVNEILFEVKNSGFHVIYTAA